MAIRVKQKATGKIGTLMNDAEFDPAVYELLPTQQETQTPVQQPNFLQKVGDKALSIGKAVLNPAYNVVRDAAGGVVAGTGGAVELASRAFDKDNSNMTGEKIIKAGLDIMTPEGAKAVTSDLQSDPLGLESAKVGAKRGLTTASYLTPAGKTVKLGKSAIAGNVLSGAASGAASVAGEGGNAGEIIGGAVIGGATGGAIQAGSNVLDKLKGLSKPTKEFADYMDKSVLNPQTSTSPTSILDEDALLEFSRERGYTGTPNEMRRQLADDYTTLVVDTDGILSASNKSAPLKDVDEGIRSLILEQGENFIPDDKTYQNLLDREMKLLNKKAQNGSLTAKDVFDFKMELGGKLKNAFRKKNGELSSALTVPEAVRLDLWQELDNIISTIEPAVKENTLTMSKMHNLVKGLEKNAKAKSTVPIIGTQIPAAPVQKATSKAADALNTTSNVLNKVPSGSILSNKPIQRGVSVGLTQASMQQPEITNNQTTTDILPLPTQTQSSTGDMESMQRLQALMLLDPDNAGVYEKLMSAQASTGGGNVGKVGADKFANAQSGMRSLQGVKSQVFNADGSVDRGKLGALLIPGSPGARQLENLMFDAVDNALRIRTGAQANESEVRKYVENYMPNLTDGDETIKQKIAILEGTFGDILTLAGQPVSVNLNSGGY